MAASPPKPVGCGYQIKSKEHQSCPKVYSGDLILRPWAPPKAEKRDFWSLLGDVFSDRFISPGEFLDGLPYITGAVPSAPIA